MDLASKSGLLDTEPTHEERGVIAFTEKMLGLLDEGQIYRNVQICLLLGLIDLYLENTSANGGPPDAISTKQLAEKVLEMYWPHTSGETIYGQNIGQKTQAEILTEIIRYVDEVPPIQRRR